ncbi:MAG: O-antigen ligase family protein [Candidatus Omnitrophota bacterium]
MIIKRLDYISEFFLFVLMVGITVNNAPTEVASYLLIFIFLLKHIIRRDIKLPSSPINIFLCMYSVVVLVTLIHSSYFGESIKGFSRVPKYIFLYLALVELFKNDLKRLNRFFWIIMVVSAVTFINGVFQSIFGFDFFRHNAIDGPTSLCRISSSFVHSNDFGSYIITVLPLTFLIFSSLISKRKRLALLPVSLLGFYCLLRTSSRGAWLGFLIAIIIYFFMYKKKIAILIPIIFIILIMFLPYGFERVTSIFKTNQGTVWERTKLWQGAWGMIKEHPVLGLGVNTFSKNFPQYKPADYPDLRYAHNSYLQMWAEIGLLGLIIFLAMPLTILAKAFKGIKNEIPYTSRGKLASLELRRSGPRGIQFIPPKPNSLRQTTGCSAEENKIKAGPQGLILLGAVCGYVGFLVQSGMDNNLFSLVLTTLFWVFSAYIVSWNSYLENKNHA